MGQWVFSTHFARNPSSPLCRRDVGLLHLVFAMPSQEKELVNEMIDLVESGLDQSEEHRMGRVLMVSVTLSLTTENTETATVTTTLVNSCVAGTFTECTTSTEAASSRALDHHHKKGRELFPDAIVTKSNGNTVDISTILPSRVEPQGRSDVDAFLDMDGVVGKTMQSGSMTWSEMEMMSPMKPACGRSGKDRRPRFVDFQQETITSTSTVTATETATATDTVTFSVALNTCTTAGFTFAQPPCA